MQEENKFKKFICSGFGKAGMIIIIYAIVFFLILGLGQLVGEGSEYIALGAMLIFAVFGWKALNKIQPDIFLFMPIIGWVIFFLIKGMLSVVLGIFVAPFVIAKKIAEIVQNSLSE